LKKFLRFSLLNSSIFLRLFSFLFVSGNLRITVPRRRTCALTQNVRTYTYQQVIRSYQGERGEDRVTTEYDTEYNITSLTIFSGQHITSSAVSASRSRQFWKREKGEFDRESKSVRRSIALSVRNSQRGRGWRIIISIDISIRHS
jgi:hypothetical protein